MIRQGAVRIDDVRIDDDTLILARGTCVIQVGKRRFAKVTIGE